jgi:hypothetical protein
MAITAAITLSSSTIKGNQSTVATCTVTNSGTSAVNVTGMQPFATPHGASPAVQSVTALIGMPPLGPGQTISVPGSSGTLAIPFTVAPNCPQASTTAPGQAAQPASWSFDIGATVYTSDGSVTAATTAQLTVNEFL